MLDKLIDIFLTIVEAFYFLVVVDEYQEGVMLRFGKYHRMLYPGLRWRIPFYIEVPIVTSVVPDTQKLATQIFTLQDGTNIAITPVLTYRVHNTKKALLEVETAESSLHDATAGAIRKLLTPHDFGDLQSPEKCAQIELEVAKAIRSDAFKWGYEVIRVQFPDLVKLDVVYQRFGCSGT